MKGGTSIFLLLIMLILKTSSYIVTDYCPPRTKHSFYISSTAGMGEYILEDSCMTEDNNSLYVVGRTVGTSTMLTALISTDGEIKYFQ